MTRLIKLFIALCCVVLFIAFGSLIAVPFIPDHSLEVCENFPSSQEKDACISQVAEEKQNPTLCESQEQSSEYCLGQSVAQKGNIQECQTLYDDELRYFHDGDPYARNACYAEFAKNAGKGLSVCDSLKETDNEAYQQCRYAIQIFTTPIDEDFERCKNAGSWRSAQCQFYLIRQTGDVSSCSTLSQLVDPLYQDEMRDCFGYFAQQKGSDVCDVLKEDQAELCRYELEAFAEDKGSAQFCDGTEKTSYYCQCPTPPVFTTIPSVEAESYLSVFPLNNPDARYVIEQAYTNLEQWPVGYDHVLLYVVNNTIAGSALIEGSYEAWSDITERIGQDVHVQGEFIKKTYTTMIYCIQEGTGCGPLTTTESILSISSIDSVNEPFALDDASASYTIVKHPSMNHLWYLVYDNHVDLPSRVRVSRRINGEIVLYSESDVDQFACKNLNITKGTFYCTPDHPSGSEDGWSLCTDQTTLLIDELEVGD